MSAVDRGDAASRWLAFTHPGFTRYWVALLCANFSVQIQTVAVGWQVYDITRDPLDLGLVGLSQFLPSLALVLVTGAVADRFPRKVIITLCIMVEALCAAGLLALTLAGSTDVRLVFAILVLFGTARAFFNPARQSIVSNLVPAAHLPNAITQATTAFHVSTIAGPMLGGLLYGVTPELAYGVSLLLLGTAIGFALSIPRPVQAPSQQSRTWASLVAGFSYIWRAKVLLGAISLDLFAVLLGGAVALLPVYARDILDVGPFGLGMLRAAPGIGALIVGFYLMSNPIRDNAGRTMLVAVALFGVFTAVFAVSELVWLSVLSLFLIGGCDMVSVFVRNTLVQLWTPDALRGRVNAVNQVFVGASNELGAFRAGGTAALLGAVPAVLAGGIGCLAVAALWARAFPALRRIRQLDAPG
ncbi:MAG: MFS transporter [Rhodobacteraceae bacterium]|jgi:MFS family permease|nr:MFS transporter [Paracoccaceae bacterium]